MRKESICAGSSATWAKANSLGRSERCSFQLRRGLGVSRGGLTAIAGRRVCVGEFRCALCQRRNNFVLAGRNKNGSLLNRGFCRVLRAGGAAFAFPFDPDGRTSFSPPFASPFSPLMESKPFESATATFFSLNPGSSAEISYLFSLSTKSTAGVAGSTPKQRASGSKTSLSAKETLRRFD